jgi:AmpE protein
MLLSERSRQSDQHEADGSAGMRDFSYRGYSRWFPSGFYYLMLGPLAAITYRLVYLANERSDGRFETAMRMLDWLPARLLLVTFSVLGDFEHTRRALTTKAFDQTVSTDALLAHGIERAWRVEAEGHDEAESTVVAVEATQKAINLSTALWVAVASVIALF